jgi:hypothetical protein
VRLHRARRMLREVLDAPATERRRVRAATAIGVRTVATVKEGRRARAV